ncbi:MAG TPA: NAD(P)H-binding protein [Bacteroidia bacterium]|jgi:putative NADH-flavin reductase|nr:NAD(P)H-binding protein [Bacteroidia bacterium]
MNTQKIALFTTTSEMGTRLAEEALKRGHNVTAIVPDETEFKLKHQNLKVVKGDVRNKEDVSKNARGHDVVISTHEASMKNPREHVEATRSLIEGAKEAGVQHLVSASHPFAQRMENTEEFYDSFKPVLQAQQEALKLLQKEKGLSWGYLHTVEPEAGQRAGEYRVSTEAYLSEPEGQSRIALKNYTSHILDEAEKNQLEAHEEYHREEGIE